MTTTSTQPSSPLFRALSLAGWILLALGLVAVVLYGVSVETGWAPWTGDMAGDSASSETHDAELDQAWRLLGGHLGGVRFDELTDDPARLEQAGEIVGDVLASDPDHPRALMLLGLQQVASGRGEEAVESVRRSAEAGGGHQSLLVLGAIYAHLGRTSDSVEVLQEAVERYPDSIAAWNNLGQALWLDGRQAEAEAAYRRKIELEDGGVTVTPDDASGD